MNTMTTNTKVVVQEAKNWIGQTISVGSKVYRGAREGNSSSFKVGVVEKITKLEKFGFRSAYTARVNWKYAPGLWFTGHGYGSEEVVYRQNTYGSPDLNSLVLVDEASWDYLELVAKNIGEDAV